MLQQVEVLSAIISLIASDLKSHAIVDVGAGQVTLTFITVCKMGKFDSASSFFILDCTKKRVIPQGWA